MKVRAASCTGLLPNARHRCIPDPDSQIHLFASSRFVQGGKGVWEGFCCGGLRGDVAQYGVCKLSNLRDMIVFTETKLSHTLCGLDLH